MEYNIRLTIQAIIRAEQLLGKPYGDIDYTKEEDVIALLYCCILANNEERITLEEFKEILSNENLSGSIIRTFEKETKILAQFTRNKESSGEGEATGETAKQYMSELAGVLIYSGVNIDYVLNKMQLSDILFLAKAYEMKKKEEMEKQRLWTFYAIIPHVDTKKLKSPSDLITFPWEESEAKKKAQEEIKKNERFFNDFMDGKISPIKK